MNKMKLFTAAALFFIKEDKVFLERTILDMNLLVPIVHEKVTRLQLKAAGLFKHVQPFSEHQTLKD